MSYVPRLSIRIKILVTMLLVVTGAVGAIVVTMANLFHEDKKTYVTDLVSLFAGATAEEVHAILPAFGERVQLCGRVVNDEKLTPEQKTELLRTLFASLSNLVSISVVGGALDAAAHNVPLLEAAGLTVDDLRRDLELHPLPLDRIRGGEVYVRNSTLSPSLPTLILAQPSADGRSVLIGVLRSDTLLRLTAKSGAFELGVIGSDGNYLAHSSLSPMERVSPNDDFGREGQWQQEAVSTREYVSRGVSVIGARAAVDFGGVVVGAQIDESAAFLASRELLARLVVVALILLVTATVIGLIVAYRLTHPLRRLTAATRHIARGEFQTQVSVESRDEIGDLAHSFNQMATELNGRERALEEAQQKLIQSEKLAAFGQLGAGIAHEVKNPLAGILGCAQLSLRKVEQGTPIEKNLLLIEKETKRCKTIIENLLRFARQEQAIMTPTNVNGAVTDAIAIIAHQLHMSQVALEQDLAAELAPVNGNANQLQQVVMNLVMNAQQAMEGSPGAVRVTTRGNRAGQVEIEVADNGPGMADDVQQRLFEPFFTTKPGGKGTGLGLSVSYGIVKDHGGEITVRSRLGEGSTFTISLPALVERPESELAGATTA